MMEVRSGWFHHENFEIRWMKSESGGEWRRRDPETGKWVGVFDVGYGDANDDGPWDYARGR